MSRVANTDDLPPGYRMTELGPLPEEWEVVRLGDAILKKRIKTNKVKQQNYLPVGRFPIVDQGQNLIAGYWNNEDDVYHGPLPVIVFGDHTRIFKYVDFPFVRGADGTKILIPNTEKYFPLFFYYALLNLKIPSRSYNRHYRILREKTLPLPPLPEQKAIAYVLRAVQEAREKTEEVIKALKELKKSLMKHLFTYGPVPLNEVGRVKLKETEVGNIPEHWEVVRLGEVAHVRYGKSKPNRTGSIPVIGSGGVYSWTYEPLVKFPTLVIGRKGTAGQVWLAENPSWPSDTTFYLEWKRVINIRFLHAYLLFSPLSGDHAKTTLPSLQRPYVEKFPIPLPPLHEQERIAEILKAVDDKIEAERKRAEALEKVFKTLLNDLMTAKRRIPKELVGKLAHNMEGPV